MGEQQKSNQTEQDLNHVLKARRDKLAELQAAGKDPFQITKYDVTAHSMDISRGRKPQSAGHRIIPGSRGCYGRGSETQWVNRTSCSRINMLAKTD